MTQFLTRYMQNAENVTVQIDMTTLDNRLQVRFVRPDPMQDMWMYFSKDTDNESRWVEGSSMPIRDCLFHALFFFGFTESN